MLNFSLLFNTSFKTSDSDQFSLLSHTKLFATTYPSKAAKYGFVEKKNKKIKKNVNNKLKTKKEKKNSN